MQLVAYGAQDIYLTGNPQITFFKVVYRRHTNFSMESIQQTWNGGSNSGTRCTATISRNGDLVHKLYFQIDTSARSTAEANASAVFNSSNPGAAWIDTVSVEIGGQTIDKQYGSWLETWAELTEINPTGVIAGANENASLASEDRQDDFQNTLFQRMAGMGGVINSAEGSRDKLNSGRYLYVPLQFWFCRNPGLALPLIALQYHEVKIIVEHKFSTVFTGTAADQQLWADYIYLDTDERRRFAQVSHEYLIEQLQMQDVSSNSATVDLNFNHPVKELIWTGTWNDASTTDKYLAGTNNSLAPRFTADTYLLKLNGHDRFAARPITYFTQAQVHQYHSGPGGLNTGGYSNLLNGSFQNNFNDSIAVYSFALKPEEHQPSGTCNFSRIDSAQLIRSGTPQAMRIYAVNYNVLRIMSGMGGLAYSN